MTESEHPDSSPVASPAPAPQEQTTTEGPLPKQHKRHKVPTPAPMRLINILVLAFLAYGAVTYFSGETVKPPLTEKPLKQAARQEAPVASEDPRIDRLLTQDSFNVIDRVFPKLRAGVGTVIRKEGKGDTVFCGQQVTYRLHEGAQGIGKAGPLETITLGNVQDYQSRGLTWGLEGAHIGEIRELQIPEDFSVTPFSNAKPRTITQVVEIVDATPVVPKMGEMPLRRFIQRGGAGYDLRCGDQVVVHMTLWDGAGHKLFSSLGDAPIYFEMGAGTGVPYGLELAVREMGPGGEYTVIIPTELIKPLHADTPQAAPPKDLQARPFPSAVKLPESGVLIVDLLFPEKLPLAKNVAPRQ